MRRERMRSIVSDDVERGPRLGIKERNRAQLLVRNACCDPVKRPPIGDEACAVVGRRIAAVAVLVAHRGEKPHFHGPPFAAFLEVMHGFGRCFVEEIKVAHVQSLTVASISELIAPAVHASVRSTVGVGAGDHHVGLRHPHRLRRHGPHFSDGDLVHSK